MTSSPARRRAAIAVTAATAAWVAALLAGPALTRHTDHPVPAILAVTVYTAGALVCHQAPTRSFHVGGVRLPVCARCAGLYVGGIVGMLGWWGIRSRPATRQPWRSPIRLLAIVAVPTAVTWAAAVAGVWDPGNVTRAVAALPLGVVIGAVVTAAVAGDVS